MLLVKILIVLSQIYFVDDVWCICFNSVFNFKNGIAQRWSDNTGLRDINPKNLRFQAYRLEQLGIYLSKLQFQVICIYPTINCICVCKVTLYLLYTLTHKHYPHNVTRMPPSFSWLSYTSMGTTKCVVRGEICRKTTDQVPGDP